MWKIQKVQLENEKSTYIPSTQRRTLLTFCYKFQVTIDK